jgi:rhodanese-related sulfurtransferase
MEHLTPRQAHALLTSEPQALLIDIRMEIEYMYVGHVPGSLNIPWYEYPDLTPDPKTFLQAVERAVRGDKGRQVLLICRSAKRTLPAGAELEQAGFTRVINILHGFEGELDENMHRGTLSGWRHDGLPWQQM